MDRPVSPRMRMVWQVLEAANERVIAACRRCILADRLGWPQRGDEADLRLVREFAETI